MANDNGMTRRALLGTAGAASLAALGAAALLPSEAHADINPAYLAMVDAHDALVKAKAALQAADAKFGGHRLTAIDLVKQALGECQAASDFADGK